jgi:putative ABC transport system permease protein
VASVDGARRKALEIVDFFGPDAVLVLGGDIENRPVGQRLNTLTWSDARAIARSLPGAYAVLPMRSVRAVTLRYGNKNHEAPTVVGATENYAATWNWPLSEGRDLSADDIAHGAKVALIGDAPAKALFGDASPIGRTVMVKNLPVQIVGRLSYRGFTGGGSDVSVDDRLIMPISTLTQRFNLDRNYFRGLRVRFHDPDLIEAHMENLRALLRHEHKLGPTIPDDFTIMSASEILKFLTAFTGGLVAFLGVTAGVAILVGGFVLANLMFLGVSERRVEIGLRKAVGATSGTILVQFLSEAVYLTLAGAILGMGLGVGLGESLSRLGMLELRLSPKIFVLSLAAALAIALAFGLRPARKAAGLDPIEALRGGGE